MMKNLKNDSKIVKKSNSKKNKVNSKKITKKLLKKMLFLIKIKKILFQIK